MARQRTHRIDAPLVGLEVESLDPEPRHVELLARRQVALQPDEALVCAELDLELGGAEARDRGGKLLGRFGGIADLARIGEERRGLEAGRQHHPVAVDDVGALGDGGGERRLPGDARLGAVTEQGNVHQPARDGEEGESEERGPDQEPLAADFQRPFGGAVDLHDLIAPRRQGVGVPRAAGRRPGSQRAHGFTFAAAPTAPSWDSRARTEASPLSAPSSSTMGVGRAGSALKRTI